MIGPDGLEKYRKTKNKPTEQFMNESGGIIQTDGNKAIESKKTAYIGRYKKPFDSIVIGDADGKIVKAIHKVIDGQKGKNVALYIWACIEIGWITKPTFTQVQDEFGDIGNKSGFNKYLANNGLFTEEEKTGAQNALKRVLSTLK